MKKQKIKSRSVVYGIIGMLCVLLFGIGIGIIINGTTRVNKSSMSEEQCQQISNQIIYAAQNNNPDLLRQLNEIYSENCNDRRFKSTKPLYRAKFAKNGTNKTTQNIPCERIESVWLQRLNDVNFEISDDAQDYINRAKIYANLADRGCKENVETYKELARKDLEIARALNNDRLDDRREATEMVETYKRLQMQNEAAKMIEKAKKLTNPAIDFIIQLEKIIEE